MSDLTWDHRANRPYTQQNYTVHFGSSQAGSGLTVSVIKTLAQGRSEEDGFPWGRVPLRPGQDWPCRSLKPSLGAAQRRTGSPRVGFLSGSFLSDTRAVLLATVALGCACEGSGQAFLWATLFVKCSMQIHFDENVFEDAHLYATYQVKGSGSQ